MNAREEFVRTVKGKTVLCAIFDGRILKTNYSKEDYRSFLESLRFNYDNSYGGDNQSGTIWLENSEWYFKGFI